MFKLNKLFPWLSIRNKLIIAFTGLSLLPILIVGIHGIISNTKMMKQIAVQNLNHDLALIQENTANLMDGIENDIRLIKNSYLNNHIRNDFRYQENLFQAKNLGDLNEELLSFIKTRGIYYQVRITDTLGNNIAWVKSESYGTAGNSYQIVKGSELGKNPEVYYLYLVKNLSRNQIALAPVELLDRNNKLIPVVSFAASIFYGGNKAGILIADVYAKNLFNTLQTYKPLVQNEEVILVSSDGHYLYHSFKKKNWNKLLAGRNEYNLQHDFSSDITSKILSNRRTVITAGSKDIISHSPLFYGYKSVFHSSIGQSFAIPLYLIVAVPKALILAPVHSYEYTFAAILIAFLLISVTLSLLATRHFTTSLATLTRGAETITRGNYNYRVKVETRDEIEKLAEQFNLMAQSLDEHDTEIRKYRMHLEEMVASRTEELSAEKSKLQAILDNVPSAFLLLDKDLRIQTASAAFNIITGYNIEDVKGENCNKIFGSAGICDKCICSEAITENKIESCINLKINDKQQERYIEHVAIPMKSNGETVAVLAVITDITKRKQLENVLVKTEKLAATGEIAAFVAHEFRNSLTSIKMILQLLAESDHTSRTEKKSVSVALNSTEEMEDTVNKLLNYAYPVPMQLQSGDINKIINESLAFVRLRFGKSRISLKKEIEPSIPLILLDASRLKEAIINVLLNAVQSIDEKSTADENSDYNNNEVNEITISIRKVILKKTLRDYKLEETAGYTQIENADRDKYEIILPKGTGCILLKITDTGLGVDSKNISRIFDPFFTTKTNGTGLGLPMVKRTINAHKGIVSVESKKGTGTTFNIYIPVRNYNLPSPEYNV